MTTHDSPITPDELHAYVDDALPADRRDAVQAWLATHPDDAANVASWRAQTDAIRARYGAAAAEAMPVRFDLDRLALSKRRWIAIAAAIVLAAFLGGAGGWFAHDAIAAAPSTSGIEAYTDDALDAHKL